MVDFITPYATDVGQFGADNNNVGRYKQAAEYAADAEKWAELAQANIDKTDELLEYATQLSGRLDVTIADVEKLKADFTAQQQVLETLKTQITAAASDAQNAVSIINQKIIEVNKALNNLNNMDVVVNELAPGTPASGSFTPANDNVPGSKSKLTLNLPKGAPGSDGSVTELGSVSLGTPTTADLGFYVEQPSNTVKKATMVDIAKVFPSVQNISYNGGSEKEVGEIDITKAKIGLAAVRNVESYSEVETQTKYKSPYKVYATKAEALADAVNREPNEMVVVWKGDSKISLPTAPATTHDIYKVDKSSGTPTLTLIDALNRIETVNGKAPDAAGNIDVTIPTGNPSLYLGEMLMFPYDPDNEYEGAGLIPADGRLVNRVDQPLLFKELVDGRLPVVSESEWQAGKKAYYSWGGTQGGGSGGDGDETTGPQFRVPDWTDGTALRTPNVATEGDGQTDEYDGQFFDQIAYIASVNTKVPDDVTGAVVLTAADVGAIATGGNAGSATKLETVRKIAGKDFDGTADVVLAATDVGALASTVKAKDIEGADVSAAGVNTNIKKLTGLEGTLTLGAPGISGNDAVSYQSMVSYVAANGGGDAGAKLNGVMTNFIGAVDWYLGTRNGVGVVGIPGYIAADGQILNRADYPDLWAAVDAGLLVSSATDAAWVASATERGKYTKGNGTTTFRVPDLNGTLINGTAGFTGPSSLAQPFLRGNAGSRAVGTVQSDQIANHTHPVPIRWFTTSGSSDLAKVSAGSKAATDPGDVVTETYGNNASAQETRPINISGIWIIRAKGNFVAANTNFKVITSDATLPANGTTYGGLVSSNYTAADKTYAEIGLRAVANIGAKPSADLLIVDNKGTAPTTVTWNFSSDSILNGPDNKVTIGNSTTHTTLNSADEITANKHLQFHTWGYENNDPTKNGGAMGFRIGGPGAGAGDYSVDDFYLASKQYWARRLYVVNGDGTNEKSTTVYSFRSDGTLSMDKTKGPSWILAGDSNITGNVWGLGTGSKDLKAYIDWRAQNPTASDSRLKTDIVESDHAGALERIEKIDTKEFTWNSPDLLNDGVRDRGFIAQDLEKIDSKYATVNKFGTYNWSANAIIADLIDSVKTLKAEIEELKANK